MAKTRDKAPGKALFHALLAYSSLRRGGLHKQALQLKISALHALSKSTKDVTIASSADAAQLLATSMLLGSFEASDHVYLDGL